YTMYQPSHSSRASSSSASTTNSSNWYWNQASKNPGDVPTAVRSLLNSTKRLQETLRLWSTGQASETQVSDIFVTIGTEFNSTVHAFAYHKIDLSDIHSIPKELREVLEQCLAEDPSPQVLDIFMPSVRQILYKLLKGLQSRQDAWKAVGGRMPMIPADAR
ncbi:hypothetical protein BDQ12DRAFT_603953, partial [Crucibulum laeve]